MTVSDRQSQQALGDTPRSPRTIADALVDLSSMFADSWIRPLKSNPLKHRWRFVYAFAGSWPWLFVNLREDSVKTISVFGEGGIFGAGALADVIYVVQIGIGLWFAWLISYQKRSCSPGRFFIEGLLFTGVTASLLSSPSIFARLFGLGGQP